MATRQRLTLKEVAAELGLCKHTVRQRVHDGHLPAYRDVISGWWYVRRADLDIYIRKYLELVQ